MLNDGSENSTGKKPCLFSRNRLGIKMGILLMAVFGIFFIMQQRQVAQAFDTGTCVINANATGIDIFLKHILHVMYRLIFKVCA
ncbi:MULTISPECIES: hypothetical protein [Pantoea]|uniref:hypothetical protein n=1 Tax=Pantoea TaxID=53335 RepID=UPI002892BBAF|nr:MULTISPECIES: hypothetical protein [unclassified Pantoea]MCG7389762.1 hypothetical protein [Pantoea sp. ACRSB]